MKDEIDQDTIDDEIAELDDEALAKRLDDAKNDDADESDESDDKGGEEDPEKDEETSENENDEEESDDKGGEEDPEKDEETPEEALRRELDESKAANTKLQEQIDEKEKFNQRQSNNVGDLRKEVDALKIKRSEEETEELRTRHQADPVETTQEMIDAALAAKDTKADGVERDRLVHAETTKRAVEEAVPNFMELVNDVADMAVGDGVSAEAIAAFKADPYGSSDAPFLLNFAKRVILAKELEVSKEEIKKLKTNPDDVAAKIQEAANKKPKIKKSSSSREKVGDNLTREDIAAMSDEELTEMRKKIGKG